MKKNIIILIGTISIFTACSSTKPITISKSELSNKDKDMIENNSNYSTASIVGGGAELIRVEKEKALKRKIENRKNKLKSIEGLVISTYKDENGTEQFKATAQNEVLFKFDSHELNESAINMLSELCTVISDIPGTNIKVVGHTDNIGEKDYNIVLSKNRAAAVGNFLRQSGIETINIKEEGKGFSQPIADNKSEAGRAKNRRVEIFISYIE